MIKFFDFDGVIVDSINECYIVSKDVYFGYTKFPYDEDEYKALFYKYRGLVRPAYEYMILHVAIEDHLKNREYDIRELFKKILAIKTKKDKAFYEKEFFYRRSLYQDNDMESWLSMNPIMPFGKTLIGNSNQDVIIVTTKNKKAVEILLDYYKIGVSKIYANDEIKPYGSKGSLITSVMDKSNIKEAIFLDDAVEHLETARDSRVKCFFADWGYGINSNYEVYQWRGLV
jgi:phosphoglycolate phosphatase-like HAD superfamily hydrolase